MMMMLLAILAGEEAFDSIQCATMRKQSWEGQELERVCCQGRVYLVQNGKIIAQDGECQQYKKRREEIAIWMTVWAIMVVKLLLI